MRQSNMEIKIVFERADGEYGWLTRATDGPVAGDDLADAADMLPTGAIVTDVNIGWEDD